jgi:CubicO group peptidase (beta-lactamase class C family)
MRFATILTVSLTFLVAFPALGSEDDQQRVDRIFAAYDKANSPGCALGVIRDGSFIYRKAYGTASLELGVPLTPQSVFYMGSVSKQFTAASIVLAAEQGFLSLDDDVHKYIPELPDYGHSITLRQMLHHTSGFRNYSTLLYLSGQSESDIRSKRDIIDLVERQKGLNNNPGDEFIYSDTNYFMLAEVVQRATKKSLAEFAAENIFKPLGMVHTRFYDDHSLVLSDRVAAYDPAGTDGRFLVDWSTKFDIVGAGGLMSSVDDLLLWDRNFYENRLGKGTLLKELQTRGVLGNGTKIRYALGLFMGTYRGLPIVEHGGALFGYRTEILRFPQQRFTVLCLCNLSTAGPRNLTQKVAAVYLEKNLQPEPASLSPSVIARFPDPSVFAGNYIDSPGHLAATFSVARGNLVAWGLSLTRLGPNRFTSSGDDIINFDNSGGHMKVTIDSDDEEIYAASRIEEFHLNDADLAAFAGVYRSTELDAAYNLAINNGNLMLRIGQNPAGKLAPIAKDMFGSDELGTLIFHRDASHRVSALSVFSIDARDVSFTKSD